MRIAAVSIAMLASCATPYQSMGFRGGYKENAIAHDRYVVTVRVNGFTERGTALEYLHRRADELCPNGYELIDRESGDNGDAFRGISKPELNAVVQCSSPPLPADRNDQPRLDPPAFFCAMSPLDSTIGVCAPTVERCVRMRDRIVGDEDSDLGPCVAASSAVCYRVIRDGRVGSGCAPTIGSCNRRREAFLEREPGTAASECADADR